ncbi:ANTAR domain protein with unknown sensor [Pseudarthrobacter chlorophenolicus A6]|uniref:ANTAR domain-containing protein n=1 Tax=Pseudarthrobacter chlorophenolicus (strain ATCC 700700 / DSM 12829 / CIP 107037 / JCM 12360 / KCTC 9906 / NCIMB 13794 / A6) TaxID=452863 RepID=B8H9Z7_PSECP|nr:ANTAR domain protein with unknown sensor [Pseudarthrobacter chlorophenolicus A6]SDQ49920.1 ANTAR domain-containing protein [Pseudarthrobacter chlorophenolicus]
MHARQVSPNFPGQRTRVLSGAGDEEAFETKASPPAVAGPLLSSRLHGPRPAAGLPTIAPRTVTQATGSDGSQAMLLDLVTGADSLTDSLDSLVAAAVRSVAGAQQAGTPQQAGAQIECAVVLTQPRRSPAITGTSRDAERMMAWEQQAAEGPTSEVLAGGHPVAVLQRHGDFRWPRYCSELQVAGFGSVLGIRLRLDGAGDAASSGPAGDAADAETHAALAFFAPDSKAFPLQVIAEARAFAGLASRSLRMALDLHTARSMASDLRSALDSRTSINVACGVIMAQNRCSYHEAFSILAKASSHRNIKVRRIAEDILERLPEGPPQSHFGH